MPIFVVTHRPPEVAPKQDDRLTFTFVTEGGEAAIEQAKDAAGEGVVQVVGGPNLIQQLLRAGLVDELQVDIMPVLFGGGLRLFDGLDRPPALEKSWVREVGARTSLTFRVLHD